VSNKGVLSYFKDSIRHFKALDRRIDYLQEDVANSKNALNDKLNRLEHEIKSLNKILSEKQG
jgi:flagellar hook-associated protein FlgK